jgi:hypothetical protein
MDFFTLFALLGLVALARVMIGLRGIPQTDLAPAIDWAAVRAQILDSLGAEAIASRAQRDATTQRRAAKRHRRWVRRATLAEGRAQALAAAKVARLEVRKAAKAAKRAKSANVAERYGHAAQRAAAVARAARKAAAVAGTMPLTGYGIKALKRATRGSTVAANALKRAARLSVAQQRNAAARVAADAANAAFAAQRAVKAAAQVARDTWADLRREALGTQQHYVWTAAKARAELAAAKAEARAARKASLAEAKALANISWEQSQEARRVLRLERKALAKAELIDWLAAGNGQVTKAAAARLAELEAQATGAGINFWLQTGVDVYTAADRGAVRAARDTVRAIRRQGDEVAA